MAFALGVRFGRTTSCKTSITVKLGKRLTSETADKQLFFFFFHILLELENISTMGVTFYNGKWIFSSSEKGGRRGEGFLTFPVLNSLMLKHNCAFCSHEESAEILEGSLLVGELPSIW
jgi:hypothetical protein